MTVMELITTPEIVPGDLVQHYTDGTTLVRRQVQRVRHYRGSTHGLDVSRTEFASTLIIDGDDGAITRWGRTEFWEVVDHQDGARVLEFCSEVPADHECRYGPSRWGPAGPVRDCIVPGCTHICAYWDETDAFPDDPAWVADAVPA